MEAVFFPLLVNDWLANCIFGTNIELIEPITKSNINEPSVYDFLGMPY